MVSQSNKAPANIFYIPAYISRMIDGLATNTMGLALFHVAKQDYIQSHGQKNRLANKSISSKKR